MAFSIATIPMPRLPIRLGRACAALLVMLTLLLAAPPASASLLHLEGPVPADLGLHDGGLAPCPSSAHCSRRDWVSADPSAALETLLPSVLQLEGIAVIETGGGYLYATATSRLFGFVDDLELYADPGHQTLQARSTSRLGDSDLGVNGRRLDRLELALKAVLEDPARPTPEHLNPELDS
jgi:uncharacterized protein (DUF1499 family)